MDLLTAQFGAAVANVLKNYLTQPRLPRIVPWGVYSASDLVENLDMGAGTLRAWTKKSKTNHQPLQQMRPGTRQFLYLGREVIRYMHWRTAEGL